MCWPRVERRQWTLMALLTDGEEAGLMGAAGLVTDREVMNRLRAYLNIESIGSSGTAVLFETGPANGWLVSPWARNAPHPRGGSYGIEVYRRLPNDTDFSILKTREIPGLNFAAVGDSYAYHTARDTPERLSRETLRTTGENVVAIVTRLQQMDITARTADWPTFMDINATTARDVWTVRDGHAVDARAGHRCHRVGARHQRRAAPERGLAVAPDDRMGVARRRAGGGVDGGGDVAGPRCTRGVSPLVRAARSVVPAAARNRRGRRVGDVTRRPLAAEAGPSGPSSGD